MKHSDQGFRKKYIVVNETSIGETCIGLVRFMPGDTCRKKKMTVSNQLFALDFSAVSF